MTSKAIFGPVIGGAAVIGILIIVLLSLSFKKLASNELGLAYDNIAKKLSKNLSSI